MSIYLIASSFKGPVKVGISNNPKKRLGALQTGHSEELFLWGIGDLVSDSEDELLGVEVFEDLLAEKIIHKKLKPTALRGEWFDDDVYTILMILENGFYSDLSGERVYMSWEDHPHIKELDGASLYWSTHRN